MKKALNKKNLAMCVVAAALFTLPLTASAADKLVVQDGVGNTVFSVNDLGNITGTGGATVKADDYTFQNQEAYANAGWQGGFYVAKRARGTSAAPAAVSLNDTIFTFDAQAWDGTTWARGGQIMGKVDGAVGPGKVPFYWTFRTMGNDGVLGDRLTINADGNVTVPDLAGTYGGGSAYVCVNNSGQLFTSETGCP